MNARVLVADPLAPDGLALLRRHLDVSVASDPAALHVEMGEIDGLIVRSRTKVTADLLEGAPRLQIIGRAGIGVDNIDVPAASARGILVVNAPLGNVKSTAEHTVALIFALARRIPAADRAVREGRWKQGYEGVQIAGKTLGLIGVGKVGREVAAMAKAIGMSVLAHDPYLPAEAWPPLGLLPANLDEVLTSADFLSVHVPLTEETSGLIGPSELARVKPGSYLINCARGGLVDEDALVEALRSGHLAGAALDVYVAEPPTDSPLLSAPNIMLTPHVAASTREAQAQVSTDIAAQVVDFFAGRPVAFPINLDARQIRTR